jgi:hypothetical protein
MRRLITVGLAAASLVGAASAASAQTVVVERYGHWEPAWGSMPPPPPRVAYWRHRDRDWYGHVRMCSDRHHGYNPHRDMYRVGHRWVRCR